MDTGHLAEDLDWLSEELGRKWIEMQAVLTKMRARYSQEQQSLADAQEAVKAERLQLDDERCTFHKSAGDERDALSAKRRELDGRQAELDEALASLRSPKAAPMPLRQASPMRQQQSSQQAPEALASIGVDAVWPPSRSRQGSLGPGAGAQAEPSAPWEQAAAQSRASVARSAPDPQVADPWTVTRGQDRANGLPPAAAPASATEHEVPPPKAAAAPLPVKPVPPPAPPRRPGGTPEVLPVKSPPAFLKAAAPRGAAAERPAPAPGPAPLPARPAAQATKAPPRCILESREAQGPGPSPAATPRPAAPPKAQPAAATHDPAPKVKAPPPGFPGARLPDPMETGSRTPTVQFNLEPEMHSPSSPGVDRTELPQAPMPVKAPPACLERHQAAAHKAPPRALGRGVDGPPVKAPPWYLQR